MTDANSNLPSIPYTGTGDDCPNAGLVLFQEFVELFNSLDADICAKLQEYGEWTNAQTGALDARITAALDNPQAAANLTALMELYNELDPDGDGQINALAQFQITVNAALAEAQAANQKADQALLAANEAKTTSEDAAGAAAQALTATQTNAAAIEELANTESTDVNAILQIVCEFSEGLSSSIKQLKDDRASRTWSCAMPAPAVSTAPNAPMADDPGDVTM